VAPAGGAPPARDGRVAQRPDKTVLAGRTAFAVRPRAGQR